jgi:DNA polymerase-3 subunit delta'
MIEEPPPKTLFVLITENEEQILPTIRSRTQLIKFPGIDKQSMADAIAQMPRSEGKNIESIAHMAKGNFITALDLLQPNEEKAFYFEQFTSIMRITYKRDWDGMFSWADNMAGIGRERQKSFLNYCMRMVRENFVMNFKRPNLVFLNNEEKEFSEHFSPFINERNIIPFSEELEKAYRDIAQNGNPKLIFLDFSLKIVKLIKA